MKQLSVMCVALIVLAISPTLAQGDIATNQGGYSLVETEGVRPKWTAMMYGLFTPEGAEKHQKVCWGEHCWCRFADTSSTGSDGLSWKPFVSGASQRVFAGTKPLTPVIPGGYADSGWVSWGEVAEELLPQDWCGISRFLKWRPPVWVGPAPGDPIPICPDPPRPPRPSRSWETPSGMYGLFTPEGAEKHREVCLGEHCWCRFASVSLSMNPNEPVLYSVPAQ